MCRRNQLPGFCAVCLGIGILVGRTLESGILSLCLGAGIICCGVWIIRQK